VLPTQRRDVGNTSEKATEKTATLGKAKLSLGNSSIKLVEKFPNQL
jgi:hypothetical protein